MGLDVLKRKDLTQETPKTQGAQKRKIRSQKHKK